MISVRYYTTLLIALLAVAIIPTAAQAQEAIPNTGSALMDGSSAMFVRDGAPFPLDPTGTAGAYKITDNSITVEAWVYPMALPAHGSGFNIVLNPYSEAPWLAYSLSINNYEAADNPVFSFEVTDGTTPYNGGYVAGPTAEIGEWTHLAGVYDGTSVKLYVNGTLVDEAPFTGNIGAGNNGYLYVGGNGTESTFVGLIDELRLWDSARTESQVTANMDGTLAGTETGLVAYWPLNESTVLSNYPATEDATPNRNALYAYYAEFLPAAAGEAPAIPATIRTGVKTIVAGESASAVFSAGGWPEPTVSLLAGPSGLEISGNLVTWTPPADARGDYQYILQAENAHATVADTGSFWVNAVALESVSHTTEDLTATVANDGTFGTPTSGEFAFNGKNGLFAGTLVIGQSEQQVSGQLFTPEFAAMTAIEQVSSAYPGFETTYEARYNDSRAADPIGLEIVQRSHSKDSAPDQGYVIVEYDITNTSGTDLTGIYVGSAMDWDIGTSGDLGGFESESGLTYMYEAGEAPSNSNYYGVSALSGEVSGQALWANSVEGESESAYYNRLTTVSAVPTTPGDFRAGVGTGPYDIAAGESVTVRFAVAGGGTLDELTTNVEAAQAIVDAPSEPGTEPQVTSSSPAPTVDGYFGETMASVGDINGDGTGDYLVHEFGPTPLHLFSGSDGSLIRSLRAADADSTYMLAYPMTSAGDVNEDGTPDFLIRGAQMQSETYAEIIVYVIDGSDDSIITTLASEHPVSLDESEGFAESIANVGDVNGDGMPDYLVSASDEVVGGEPMSGRAYLFSGADASVIHTFEALEDGFGETVARAGDLDGDGVPDVLIGSPYETVSFAEDAGVIHAYSGATGDKLYTIMSPEPAASEMLGADEQVVSAGDINEDSIPDILAGAEQSNKAYVFDGSDGSLIRTITAPGAAPSSSGRLLASSTFNVDNFGEVLAAGQDASGDAVPDFLIEGNNSVYVISGESGESLSRLVAPAGESANSGFGASARFIDDANDDGLPEIIIGAPEAAVSSKANAGRTYVYSSSQIGTSVETPTALADGFHLYSAFPNPVSGRATIRYEVPRASDVRLEVYDVLGRRVATLARGMVQAGTHDAFLEAASLSSGVYFYRLSAGEYTTTRSLVVVK